MSLEQARAVADAVLYEGYLLYPYRATSSKNHSRWQFGVLGPPGAAEAGLGELPGMSAQLLVGSVADDATISVRLRFLQLQTRDPQQRSAAGGFETVDELVVGEQHWLRWDEAVEQEPEARTWQLDALRCEQTDAIDVPGGEDVDAVLDDAGTEAGRLVRNRRPLHAELRLLAERADDTLLRVSVNVENVAAPAVDVADAIVHSFIGAHLLVSVEGAEFVSMTDPPPDAADAASRCTQQRCWPVLAGTEGDHSLMLVSPIILYDHPEVAEQSAGSLFDSTEIDEILTLRVMTMTDAEKASARATDAKAGEIIDRCDAMTPEAMQQLHGVLRDPHAGEMDPFASNAFPSDVDLSSTLGFDGDVPWWDPAVDSSVDPSTDAVTIRGVRVAKGSTVRVHPSRRSDAQDFFYAGQLARVTAVLSDVDGQHHVAVVLADDPAAEMHDWYGRYMYFAPDEIEPVPAPSPADGNREETRS